jgi:hypothetical protein
VNPVMNLPSSNAGVVCWLAEELSFSGGAMLVGYSYYLWFVSLRVKPIVIVIA